MNINTFGPTPQSLYTRIDADKQGTDRVLTPLVRRSPQITDQAIQEEGKNEQMIKEVTKKEEDRQTVSDLIRKSNRCITKISSHFLFQLFPNSIEVEESRVTFIFRQFLSSQSYSVNIKDISNVFIQTSIFFATLQIISRTFTQNDITIGHLHPKKARQVQMIIEGLRTFSENNIDTSNYEVDELIAKIQEFHSNKTI